MIQVRAEFRTALSECALGSIQAQDRLARQPMLGGRIFHVPLTSSRDRACLNTLIVLLVPTKGSVLRLRVPTLATVSLQDRDDGHTRSWVASEDGGYEPHAEELYGYLTTERLFETRCHLLALRVRRLVQLIREGDLL